MLWPASRWITSLLSIKWPLFERHGYFSWIMYGCKLAIRRMWAVLPERLVLVRWCLDILRLTKLLDNPSGSKILIPCSGNDWSCDYDCSSSIFTVASGTFELSAAQKTSLCVDNSTTTSPVTPTSISGSLMNNKIATVAVGAGIGLPLLFLLIIAVSLFIWERRKHTKLRISTEYSPQAGSRDQMVKRTRTSDWRDEKIFYESQSQYGSEQRSNGTIHGDSKAWRKHKIHDDMEDVIDNKALPKEPKQSYHGPGNALHVPSSIYELRAMTPVMELDVRPNSRIRY